MNAILNNPKENWDIIVIGGGQAGLAMGYHLKEMKKDYLILDASEKIGDSWRNRWDSLQLFTPAWTIKHPGVPFPGDKKRFPSKDELADFLRNYAVQLKLPVLNSTRVTSLSKNGKGYEITTGDRKFTCRKVIVATGNYGVPKIPSFAWELNPGIKQLDSSLYKRPTDLPAGDVLVVGAATSGLQIALELAKTGRKVYVSGTPAKKIPPFMLKYFGRFMIWMMNNMMTIKTKPGRKTRDAIKVHGQAAPLINISMEEVIAAGAKHLGKVKGTKAGYPLLADDRVLNNISAVIWCTGFTRDYSWIKNMNGIIDDHNYPVTYRGVSTTQDGLYFLGTVFQYALTSSWLLGVNRDAAFIAEHIGKHP